MDIGAQLYTTRNLMKTPGGIRSTLERVAAIGYKYIQCSGFEYDAAWMKALCDELGLAVRLTHSNVLRILGDTQALIEEHKIMECPYVGLGGMPGQYRCAGGAEQFVKDFTPAMEALHAAGLKFQYHNHAFEFIRYGGQTLFDGLLKHGDPALLGFTLDTYWAQVGGMDVVDLIRKMRGRIDVCHLKDMCITEDKEQRFAAIGSGNMNFPGILAAFEEIGAEYAFVEQDACYEKDPLDELEASYRYLAG